MSLSARRSRRSLGVLLTGLLLVLGAVLQPAMATQITSPGGGEKFKLSPGDLLRVGYDFTIPGNSSAVAVRWTNPKATINFKCANGSTGSFVIPMPDYQVTVSDSKWYPSGDQKSDLVYQGSANAPNGCGNGGVMEMTGIAAFTADVTSNPSGVKVNYRFHNAVIGASGSWSSTNSVVTSPLVEQYIKGEIYLCDNGTRTTTLAPGGTIAVPSAGLSSSNPLTASPVAAGSYGMNATAPSSYEFVACGQSGVTISGDKGSASQTVDVPVGGTGDGRFYVKRVVQYIKGEIYLCSSGSPTTNLAPGGSLSAAGITSGNPLPQTAVAAGSYRMDATAPGGYIFVKCGQSGVTIPSSGSAYQTVTVPSGGVGDGRFYVKKGY